MERRIRNKHVDKKIRGDEPVNLYPRCADVVQSHISLNDEQRADFIGRKDLHGIPDLANRTLRLLIVEKPSRTEEAPLAEMFERTAQLRLKDDRQRDKEQCHGFLQQPRDDMQIKPARHHRDAEQHKDTLAKCNGAGILEHDIDAVENDRHDENIEYIERCDGRQNAAKLRRHRKIKRHMNPQALNFPLRLSRFRAPRLPYESAHTNPNRCYI